MKRIFSMAGSNDEVIFFFSGHGVPGAFCVYDGRLPYSHIRDAMAKGQATRKFIIADACFAGDFRTEKKQQYDNSPDKKADVMLFLSSRNNEKSIEKRFSRNGLFTTYLLNGLKGKADKNRNRKIEAKELFNYVWRHVKEDSRDRQHPVMWGRFKDTMPVMSW